MARGTRGVVWGGSVCLGTYVDVSKCALLASVHTVCMSTAGSIVMTTS